MNWLQWGRTREGAEGIQMWRARALHGSCFSGAAPVKVRKDAGAFGLPFAHCQLQWGRTREGAEGSGFRVWFAKNQWASVGPHP